MSKYHQFFVLSIVLGVILWGASFSHAQYYARAQQDSASLNTSKQTPETIIFILDASDSMNEKMGGQPKIDIAKNVVLNTIQSLPPHINVGLRVYGHRLGRSGGLTFGSPLGVYRTGGEMCRQSQLLVAPGTQNRQIIANQLMSIQAVGKTPITYSLRESVRNDFHGIPGKKTIVLVSDGRETCSFNPCDLALDMVRSGIDIKINTIGFGTRDKVADDQLKCIALSTKGRFYTANTAAELAKSLQDSSQVQTSVQAKIETGP